MDAYTKSERPFSLPSWAELLTAVPKTYAHNAEIFGEQEPLEYLYKVVSGTVRTFKVLGDGRRHVAAFYLSGDFSALSWERPICFPLRPLPIQKFCVSTIVY